jgi:hypothetical protein
MMNKPPHFLDFHNSARPDNHNQPKEEIPIAAQA